MGGFQNERKTVLESWLCFSIRGKALKCGALLFTLMGPNGCFLKMGLNHCYPHRKLTNLGWFGAPALNEIPLMRSTPWKLQNLLQFDNLALKLKDSEASQSGWLGLWTASPGASSLWCREKSLRWKIWTKAHTYFQTYSKISRHLKTRDKTLWVL